MTRLRAWPVGRLLAAQCAREHERRGRCGC